jgi:hypothetical protein
VIGFDANSMLHRPVLDLLAPSTLPCRLLPLQLEHLELENLPLSLLVDPIDSEEQLVPSAKQLSSNTEGDRERGTSLSVQCRLGSPTRLPLIPTSTGTYIRI